METVYDMCSMQMVRTTMSMSGRYQSNGMMDEIILGRHGDEPVEIEDGAGPSSLIPAHETSAYCAEIPIVFF